MPWRKNSLSAPTPEYSHHIYLPHISKPLTTGPSPTNTPTVTPSPSSTPTPTQTSTQTPVFVPSATYTPVVSGIANGDFENGRDNSWQEDNNREDFLALVRRGDSIDPPVTPTSGQWLAALFARDFSEVSQIWQTVTLPASGQIFLKLSYLIKSEESCDVPYYDSIAVYIDNTIVVDWWDICDYYSMENWDTDYIDLSSYAGQTVQITFEISTLDGGLTTLFLDDISIITTK